MKKGKWKQLAAVCTAAAAVMGLTLPAATVSAQEKTERLWDFCDGTQGWVYDDSWKGDCEVTGGASYDAEKGMLKVDVDFTAEQDNGWCQSGISFSEEGGIDYSMYNTLSFDLYYDTAAFTTGQITLKAASDNVFQEQLQVIADAAAEDAGGTLQ